MRPIVIIALAAAIAVPAVAQTPSRTSPGQPASKSVQPRALSEGEARALAQKAGYSQITALKRDSSGFWQASAYKGRERVHISFDDVGNISSQPLSATRPPVVDDTVNDRTPPKK